MPISKFFIKKNNGEPKSAGQRKLESLAILESLKIPFINHLPLLEEESEVKIRTAQDIAERVLILSYLSYAAVVPVEKTEIIGFLKQHSLWDKISPNESRLFEQNMLIEKQEINISWYSEAIWLLLWAINKADKLALPIEQVEINDILQRLPDFLANPEDFIVTAKLRSTSEILDASDLIYRLH